MNPTFSSPVLTERCTYRWEDLEKAAQGIFTDELRAEQKRLSSDYATAQAVTENLLGQIDVLVAAVLTEAAGKVKTEMAAAVNEAVARGIREGLEKARRRA